MKASRALPVAAVSALVAAVAPAAPAAGDGVRDRSWHLATLRVSEAHKISQGDGIVVAVIDTGVDADHPDLRGNVRPGFDVLDRANKSRGQRDPVGHGTSVASLIAGHGHGPGGRDGVLGIAPKATIVPYSVYDQPASGAAPGATARAIRRATDDGADVICVALAGGFERGDEAAVEYANSRDVLVVAGVGNSPAVLVMEPAGIAETVAVTAVDRDGKLATTVRGVPDREIDIAAPGAGIEAALPGGRYHSATGTSAATAIVAGSVALIRARHPQARRNELLQRLVWTTTDVGPPGRDFEYGWGTLNLVAALTTEPRRPPATRTATATAPVAAPPRDSNAGAGRTVVIAAGALLLAIAAGVATTVALRRRRPSP